jgi:hypothetical protein
MDGFYTFHPGKTCKKNKLKTWRKKMNINEKSNGINPNDIQAGILSLDSQAPSAMTEQEMQKTSTPVKFETPFKGGGRVIVIPMVQTFNGHNTPGLRITGVDHTGFRIRINELVAHISPLSDGEHASEDIGWIAIRIA